MTLTNLEIIEQVLNGNHLEKEEVNRAFYIVSQMQINLNKRVL